MLVVIAGTNRPQSNTAKVARICASYLESREQEVTLLDLHELPPEIFEPSAYQTKPASFARFQDAIDRSQGVLTVVPEYNGSFPGALKYFVDMLAFPTSLVGMPSGFVGVAAGQWGALRAVEQLQAVFQYRMALLDPVRTFMPAIHSLLDEAGQLKDEVMLSRLQAQLDGFCTFVERNPRQRPPA